jgi:hypothetical protein
MQALGHYKICTICRNIFQLFARNNAVDFFTRYISAGAAPGCLGIMSVCIEQKIKTRVCAPRAAAACSPIAAFACGSLLFNLVAIQTASSMVFFFYCSTRINCANSVSLMEICSPFVYFYEYRSQYIHCLPLKMLGVKHKVYLCFPRQLVLKLFCKQNIQMKYLSIL